MARKGKKSKQIVKGILERIKKAEVKKQKQAKKSKLTSKLKKTKAIAKLKAKVKKTDESKDAKASVRKALAAEVKSKPAVSLDLIGSSLASERVTMKRPDRTPTGIPGLDEMTGGGLEEQNIILLNGDPGSGKTILGLQFLYDGAKNGIAGLYIKFGGEPKSLLYPRLADLGMDFQDLEDKRLFFVIEYQPHEVAKLIQEEGGTIYDLVSSYDIKRIVIDPITPYITQYENLYDARLSLVRLFQVIRKFGSTTLLLNETPTNVSLPLSASLAEFLVDGVINLLHTRTDDGVQLRGVEIWKMVGAAHSEIARPFAITKRGIIIYPSERLFSLKGESRKR